MGDDRRAGLRAAFIAIGVGGRSHGRPVEEMLERLRSTAGGIRWLEPLDLHLTVAYLGDIDDSRAQAVTAAGASLVATVPPPVVAIAGLGGFPNAVEPRVAWAGISSPTDGLDGLKAAVDHMLEPLGFEPEQRPFRPHVTLARARSRQSRRELAAIITGEGRREYCRFVAPDLSLFARDPDGHQRYVEVVRLPFLRRAG